MITLLLASMACAPDLTPAGPRYRSTQADRSPFSGIGVFGPLILGAIGLTWAGRKLTGKLSTPDPSGAQTLGRAMSNAIPVAGLGTGPLPELKPDIPIVVDYDDGHIIQVEAPPTVE